MSRKCPTCEKTVYMGEKKASLGNWYHPLCLKCKKCGRQLATGSHAERQGQPYCHKPCYAAEFGPKGFGHGGTTESHKYWSTIFIQVLVILPNGRPSSKNGQEPTLTPLICEGHYKKIRTSNNQRTIFKLIKTRTQWVKLLKSGRKYGFCIATLWLF